MESNNFNSNLEVKIKENALRDLINKNEDNQIL